MNGMIMDPDEVEAAVRRNYAEVDVAARAKCLTDDQRRFVELQMRTVEIKVAAVRYLVVVANEDQDNDSIGQALGHCLAEIIQSARHNLNEEVYVNLVTAMFGTLTGSEKHEDSVIAVSKFSIAPIMGGRA